MKHDSPAKVESKTEVRNTRYYQGPLPGCGPLRSLAVVLGVPGGLWLWSLVVQTRELGGLGARGP